MARVRMLGLGLALVATGFLAGSGLVRVWAQAPAQTHEHGQASRGWLARLGPDARVQAIERQFRGFETTMAEVAYRYTEMYFGGIDGNWDYAQHMITEMKGALAAGLERRPQHGKSADALFFKTALPQMEEAIKKKDPELFKKRVDSLRAACTACHAAEAHAFIKIGIPTVRRNPLVNP